MFLKNAIFPSVAVLAFFSLGCEPEDTGRLDGYRGPINSCKNGGDCPQDSICDSDLAICTSTAPIPSRDYFVKVIPRGNPNAEDQVPDQAFKVTVGSDNQGLQTLRVYDLSLNLKFRVAAFDRDDYPTSLDVKIIIVDNGMRIPGEQPPLTIKTVSIPSDGSVIVPSLKLLPGDNHSYQIKIIPQGDKAGRFPVTYFDNVTVSENSGVFDADGNQNPVFPIREALTVVTGTITRGDQPVDGLSVQALSQGNGRVVSTRATTGCSAQDDAGDVCGDFEIRLARGVNFFSLRVWRENEPWYPEVVVPGFFVQPELKRTRLNSRDLRADLGMVELAPLETPVRYTAIVTKPVALPGGATADDGVENSLVIFSSSEVGGGSVDRTVFTNETGKLEVDLFPGPYKITVVPPGQLGNQNIDYSVLSWDMEQISGTSEIVGQEFPLEERPLFTGSIEFDNKKVFNAILRAEPYAGAHDYSRASSAVVDSSGFYSLWVDKGAYRLTAEVTDKSGWAWAVKDVEVEEDDDFDIQLPVPFTVDLWLVGKDDSTAKTGGATVEFYEEVDGRAFMVARTTSDAGGWATALLRP